MLSDHHMCDKGDKLNDIIPLSNAHRKAQSKGYLTFIEFLLQNLRTPQHTPNPHIVT